MTSRAWIISAMIAVVAINLGVSGCGQAAPAPSPTAAAAPAAPTKATTPAVAATAAPAAPTAAPAKAVSFPEKGKVITIIVPFAAGGATDVVARVVAAEMEKDFGTPVQIVNKAAAGGQEGIMELTKSKPDGYTISITALPTTVANYMDPERKMTISRKDFTMLARIIGAPLNVAVKTDSPYKDVNDLINDAKANPGKVPLVAGTQLGSYHLASLLLQKVTGVTFAVVNMDSAKTMAAVLGGHVNATINQAGELMPSVKSGAIRILGVMDSQESKLFPGVKTLEAQGIKAYMSTNNVAVAPAGTPKEVVDVLSAEIEKICKSPQVVEKAASLGLEVRYLNGQGLDALWADLETQVGPMVKEIRSQK